MMSKKINLYLMFFVFFIPNILCAADPLSTWNVKITNSVSDLRSVAYGNSTFIAVGDSSSVFLSKNYGSDWINTQRLGAESFQEIIFGGNKFWAVGYELFFEITSSKIIKSFYGSDWVDIDIGSNNSLSGAAYGNGKYVIVGNLGMVVFTNDSSWVEDPYKIYSSIAYGDSVFVAVDDYGGILKSFDGGIWLPVSQHITNDRYRITYGNGKFVAVGSVGNIFYSSNKGDNWSSVSVSGWGGLYGVAYGNTTFVAVGDTGTVLTSPNGINWTSRNSSITDRLLGVTYGGNTFIAVGEKGSIIASNQPPRVILQADKTSGTVPLAVRFTAGASDTDGYITKYAWYFSPGDSFESMDSSLTHNFNSVGTYNVKVTVTDNSSATAEANIDITVLPSISLDTTLPVIDTTLFGFLNNGEDSYVTVTVTDNIALKKGELFVKKKGEGDNAYVSIFKEDGLIIKTMSKRILIPKEYITPRGLVYKITAVDWTGNSKEVTGYFSVKVKNYTVMFPMWTWQMISFPLILDNKDINDALGPMRDRRVYRWDPNVKEYSNTTDSTFDPGDAFWFKIKEDNVLDSVQIKVNGVSVDSGKFSPIILPPGWSQIANPYFYRIASSKIKVKQDSTEFYVNDTANVWVENQFMTYDYDSVSGKNSYMDLTIINPDIGFWVKNRSAKNVSMVFPELESDATGLMPLHSPSQKVKQDGWGLKLKVMAKDYIDNDNCMGFMPGAKAGYDFYDLSEPPPVDNYVSLSFQHSDWGKDKAKYRTDYRNSGKFGEAEIVAFDFTVEANIKDKATLKWDVINPPLNYRVTLYDKNENKKINIAEIKDYSFDWLNGETRREFSMIVEWDNIYLMNSLEISDLDLNHVIDGEDLILLGLTFGKQQGENKWNSKGDLNRDDIVDGSDLFILGKSFGKNY